MQLQRQVNKAERGPGRSLYTVKVFSPDCEFTSRESLEYRFGLLRESVDNTDILNCGGARFENLKVYYDGRRWVLEASAISDT